MIKSAPPHVISATVHTSSALSRVAWEPVSYHWVVIATTQWFQDGSALRVLIVFGVWGRRSVFRGWLAKCDPREPQQPRHPRTCRKRSFRSLTPDFRPQQPRGGVGCPRPKETLQVRLPAREVRSADLPAAFPLSRPRPAASPRAFLETQLPGRHPHPLSQNRTEARAPGLWRPPRSSRSCDVTGRSPPARRNPPARLQKRCHRLTTPHPLSPMPRGCSISLPARRPRSREGRRERETPGARSAFQVGPREQVCRGGPGRGPRPRREGDARNRGSGAGRAGREAGDASRWVPGRGGRLSLGGAGGRGSGAGRRWAPAGAGAGGFPAPRPRPAPPRRHFAAAAAGTRGSSGGHCGGRHAATGAPRAAAR